MNNNWDKQIGLVVTQQKFVRHLGRLSMVPGSSFLAASSSAVSDTYVNPDSVLFKDFEQVFLHVLEDQVQSSFPNIGHTSLLSNLFDSAGHSPCRALPDKAVRLAESRAWTYRLKASLSVTMFLYLSMRSILTSLIMVFFAISSSSGSLNFLMPTAIEKQS